MTRLHDEGHLPTPPECSQDGYDNNGIIRSIPKPQTFLKIECAAFFGRRY